MHCVVSWTGLQAPVAGVALPTAWPPSSAGLAALREGAGALPLTPPRRWRLPTPSPTRVRRFAATLPFADSLLRARPCGLC